MSLSLQPGEVFNPFRVFTGVFIPEGLVRCDWISAGAKLAWGRLARYAGEDGRCYPTVKSLAAEIGLGARQGQKYVAELERARLIRRKGRFQQRAQTSNEFDFLWHEMFTQGVNDRSGEGVTDPIEVCDGLAGGTLRTAGLDEVVSFDQQRAMADNSGEVR